MEEAVLTGDTRTLLTFAQRERCRCTQLAPVLALPGTKLYISGPTTHKSSRYTVEGGANSAQNILLTLSPDI
jgi:hypothetical protein